MKYTTPEISWHNKDPVLSLDLQPVANDGFYRLASAGSDSHLVIWHLTFQNGGAISAEPVSELTKHQKAVNVVRWSPSGQYLASGDDDGFIIMWYRKSDDPVVTVNGNKDEEKWSIYKILRGHKEDVYDISWSNDSSKLVSGSVDNTAIIWDLSRGTRDNILTEHKGFVQGVAWDPLGHHIATLSSDRTCRIYNETGKQVKYRISKGQLPVPESHPMHGQTLRYYHDDTLKSFFRRLAFSPDGTLLITPAGYLETSEEKLYATYIYTTHSLVQPAAIIPSPKQCTVAVRCCPLLFELRKDGPDPVILLPYRMIIAIATYNSVMLYDTQQMTPFSVILNIHYTRLTDLAWSYDGRVLLVSSTDGFCSLITFEENELGIVYKEHLNEKHIEQYDSKEIVETGSIKTTEINVKRKKEKKSSYLMQWAKNATKGNSCVDRKSSDEIETIVIDDDDVQIVEPNNEKENIEKHVKAAKINEIDKLN